MRLRSKDQEHIFLYPAEHKKDIDNGKQSEKMTFAAMIQAIQDEIRERGPETLTKDEVTEIIVNRLNPVAPMGVKTTNLFRKLMKGKMKQPGKKILFVDKQPFQKVVAFCFAEKVVI